MKTLRLLAILLFLSPLSLTAAIENKDDPTFNKLVEDFIAGYLAAHPLEAVSLGFHEFDGKVPDLSRAAIDAELARLQHFDHEFQKVDVTKISARDFSDLRLVRTAIKNQTFGIVDLGNFERNPMTYVNALDVNVYSEANFAPLEDRVRSMIAIGEWRSGPARGGQGQSSARTSPAVGRAIN